MTGIICVPWVSPWAITSRSCGACAEEFSLAPILHASSSHGDKTSLETTANPIMFDQLTSWNNLLLAYQKASRGKRGLSYVAAFEHRLEDHLFELQHELCTQTYRPGPYESFYIHEPKRRLISAAPFRDRVVHHALCNLIEPIFERSFIFDSYANRIGKGTHRALDRCQQFARRFKYVWACDVRQFFPSIDYAILRAALARKGFYFQRKLRQLISVYHGGQIPLLLRAKSKFRPRQGHVDPGGLSRI